MACDNDNFFDCPNADEPGSPSIQSRESILSDLSEGHELPSEEKFLMEILKRAMKCVREVVKRGKEANRLKASYATKIGQKMACSTQFFNAQKKREALA